MSTCRIRTFGDGNGVRAGHDGVTGVRCGATMHYELGWRPPVPVAGRPDGNAVTTERRLRLGVEVGLTANPRTWR